MSLKSWHYRYRYYIFGTFFTPKRFLITQLKVTYFDHFSTLNFRNFFLVWKKTTFKWVYISQNFIFHHFLARSNCPIMHTSKNYFGLKIFGILNLRNLQKCKKYQIFLDQNNFLRYEHMELGVLKQPNNDGKWNFEV